MAVNHQSPLLVSPGRAPLLVSPGRAKVTARKKRFLELVQGLCDEFDSLQNAVHPGDGTTPAGLIARTWTLPLEEADHAAPPAERPWGVNTGVPPPSLPRAASSDSGKLRTAMRCRPMKEPEAEEPPAKRHVAQISGLLEDVQAELTEVSDKYEVSQQLSLDPMGYKSEDSLSRINSLFRSEGAGLAIDGSSTVSEIVAGNAGQRQISNSSVLDIDGFAELDEVGNPAAASHGRQRRPSDAAAPEGDNPCPMSPVSATERHSSGSSPDSNKPVGVVDTLTRASSFAVSFMEDAMNGKEKDTILNDKHWSRNHIKTIYDRKGFMTSMAKPTRLTAFCEGNFFKFSAAALIVLNSVFVGVEMDMAMSRSLDGQLALETSETQAINAIFTTLFTLELSTRIVAYRIHFFLGDEWQWNMFDAGIVLSALAEYALSGLGGLSAMRALRALRLAKTLRIIRVVTVFRNLQLIVQGLMNSLLSLVWMIFLMCLIMYLVAIIFIGAASNYLVDKLKEQAVLDAGQTVLPGIDMSYGEMRASFERYYATLPRGMYTMFLSVTGGLDWFVVVQPLMNLSWVYAVVFALFVVFVVFGVFNVLNAVFVEAVLTNRDKDLLIQSEQAKTKMFMKDLADLFKEGDDDGSNSFSREELEKHCQNPRFCAYLSTQSLDASDAEVLFEMLDVDGDGTIDIEEFVLGAMKLKGTARCLDMVKAQSNFKQIQGKVDRIQRNIHAIGTLLKSMQTAKDAKNAGTRAPQITAPVPQPIVTEVMGREGGAPPISSLLRSDSKISLRSRVSQISAE